MLLPHLCTVMEEKLCKAWHRNTVSDIYPGSGMLTCGNATLMSFLCPLWQVMDRLLSSLEILKQWYHSGVVWECPLGLQSTFWGGLSVALSLRNMSLVLYVLLQQWDDGGATLASFMTGDTLTIIDFHPQRLHIPLFLSRGRWYICG